MWYFSAARLGIGSIFLLVASIRDLKTRRVPNELWMVMGSIAIVLLFIELLAVRTWFVDDIDWIDHVSWTHFLIFIPIIVIFSEAFIERPPVYSKGKVDLKVLGWLLLPLIVFVFMLNSLASSLLFWTLVMIPAMMLFAFLLYFFYILYGGADAKAIITIAILVPFYPYIPRVTNWTLSSDLIPMMQTFFPFTLVVLLNASIIVAVFPIGYFFINIFKGDIDLPKMFFGFKKRTRDIEDSFVWPMEYYEDGKLKTELFPRSNTEEKLDSLKKHKRKYVWTTPKIPFIVPIFIGFMISFVIGNPLMYMM